MHQSGREEAERGPSLRSDRSSMRPCFTSVRRPSTSPCISEGSPLPAARKVSAQRPRPGSPRSPRLDHPYRQADVQTTALIEVGWRRLWFRSLLGRCHPILRAFLHVQFALFGQGGVYFFSAGRSRPVNKPTSAGTPPL